MSGSTWRRTVRALMHKGGTPTLVSPQCAEDIALRLAARQLFQQSAGCGGQDGGTGSGSPAPKEARA